MHQHIRAFDDTDPDAGQALEDALPIVEELLFEKAKPEPRSDELRDAWLAQQSEIRSRLTGLATRAGCTVDEIEQLAEMRIRRGGARPVKAPAFTSPTAPDLGRKELTDQLNRLYGRRNELIAIEGEAAAIAKKVASRLKRVRVDIERLEKRLFRRRARG